MPAGSRLPVTGNRPTQRPGGGARREERGAGVIAGGGGRAVERRGGGRAGRVDRTGGAVPFRGGIEAGELEGAERAEGLDAEVVGGDRRANEARARRSE